MIKNFGRLFVVLIAITIFLSALLLISCEIDTTEKNKPFTVTFLGEGPGFKVLETVDGKITLPEDPTKNEYVFEGWYIAGTNEKFNPEEKITKDIQVYAKWKVKEYTLTFKDGNEVIATKSVANNSLYGELPTLEKTGYTYKWMLGEKEITEHSTVNLTEDVTINALWEGEKYYVTLDTKEGQKLEREVTYGSTYGELFTPTKTGYAFNGWYLDESLIEETSIVTTAANHTLVPRWTIETYNILYYNDDRKIEYNTNSPVEFNIEDEVIVNDPTKTGYLFKGWYYSSEFTDKNKVDFNNLPAHDIYLYPHFEEETFSINYENMDGATNNMQNPHSYKYFDETINISTTNVTKVGYEFNGWYLDQSFNKQFAGENIRGDLIVYAKWKIIDYSLALELNGGNYIGEVPNTYNVETKIILNDPEKQYYVFDGWYLDASFTNKLDLETIYTGVITLYAKWIEHPLLDSTNYVEIPYGLEQINVYKNTQKNICLTFDAADPIENTTISNENALNYLNEEKNILIINKDFFNDYAVGKKIDVDITFESGLVKRLYFTRTNTDPYQLQAFDYDLSNTQNYLIRIVDSNISESLLNVTIDGESVPFNYNAGDITIDKQFMLEAGVGRHLIKVYTNNAISSAAIKITNNSPHVPYNVKIDLDSSFPNIYVTWDYDLVADYVKVSFTGLQEYDSSNPMHQSYFISNNKFDATNILKVKGTSCTITVYKGEESYTSEPVLMPISLYQTNTSSTYVKNVEAILGYPGNTGENGYSLCGKQYNFYITSMEEFFNLILFMIRCPDSPVMQEADAAGEIINSLLVVLDIDLEERTNYPIKYDGTPSLTNEEYVKAMILTAYSWVVESETIRYGTVKYDTNSLNADAMYVIALKTITKNRPVEYNPVANSYLSTEVKSLNHYGNGLEEHEKLPIDNVEKTAYCEDSVQLYLALQNGYRPIFDENNATLSVLYSKMVAALRSIVDYSMNDYQIAVAIFEYIKNNTSYDRYSVYSGEVAEEELVFNPSYFLEGVFNNKVAVCNGLAAAYSCMLNMMGIKAEKLCGKTANAGHAWVKFCIAGEWYLADPTWGDNTFESGSVKYDLINYNYLFITYEKSYQQGRIETRRNVNQFAYEGDVYIDVFANMSYTYEGQTYDHIVESISEYGVLLSYLKSMCEIGDQVCTQIKAIDDNLLQQLRNIYISGVQVLNVIKDGTLIIKVTRTA